MPLLVTSASGANGNGFGALLAFDLDGSLRGTFIEDDRIADPPVSAFEPHKPSTYSPMNELPSPEFQVQFLLRIQRLLNEGGFSATYKYALLVALADIAVESGDDTDATLVVPVSRIAEKYIAYYWRQAVPYFPQFDQSGIILWQNNDRKRQAAKSIPKTPGVRGVNLREPSTGEWRENGRKLREAVPHTPGIDSLRWPGEWRN
jgi:hypothetical protein